MRRALIAPAAILLATALAVPPALAGHEDAAALPSLSGEPPVDDAVAWLSDKVDERGCVRYQGDCKTATNKFLVRNVAHAGVDPATWPEPTRSVLDWLLIHADDIRDSQLKRCEDDPTWSRPDVCMQRKVMSLSKSILAFRAAGLDPRAIPLPDDGQRNLVAELLQNFTGGQFGSPGYVNDDVWAVIALNSVPYDGPEVEAAIEEIEEAQRPNGGLGYVPSEYSVDTTAAGVMALAPHEREGFVERALGYLEGAQVASGDHRACWPIQEGSEANLESTAWTVQALVAAGEDPLAWSVDGRSPVDCVLGFQAGNGGFRHSPKRGQDGVHLRPTYQALPALAWTPYGSVRSPVEPLHLSTNARADATTRLHVPDGFLRVGDEALGTLRIHPRELGERTYHGFTWKSSPRPLTYTVHVVPGLPDPPNVTLPDTAPHGSAVQVSLESTNRWTSSLVLELPDGSIRRGANHAVRFPTPGNHTVTAWGVNSRGEMGQKTTLTHRSTNAPPHLELPATMEAPRTQPLNLTANVTDPEDDVVHLHWTRNGVPAGNGTTLTLPPGPPGNVTLHLAATDPWNATSTATVNVTWLDTPPAIQVHGPRVTAVGTVNLTSHATDPDGDPVNITWHRGNRTLGHGSTLTLRLGAGVHNLTARATTPYATAETVHRVEVRPHALTVRVAWNGTALVVDAPAEEIRVGNRTGPPPLRLPNATPGSTVVVDALEDGTVTANATVQVPPEPALRSNATSTATATSPPSRGTNVTEHHPPREPEPGPEPVEEPRPGPEQPTTNRSRGLPEDDAVTEQDPRRNATAATTEDPATVPAPVLPLLTLAMGLAAALLRRSR